MASGVVVAALAFSRYLAVQRDIEAGVVQVHGLYIYLLVGPCIGSGLLLLIYLVLSWPI